MQDFKIFAFEKEAHPLPTIKAKNMPLEAAIANEIAKAHFKYEKTSDRPMAGLADGRWPMAMLTIGDADGDADGDSFSFSFSKVFISRSLTLTK